MVFHVSPTDLRRVDPEGWLTMETVAWAVVDGTTIYASGVVPMDGEGRLIGADDPRAQARACFDNIEALLAAAGSSVDDIIRLTCFATSATAARAFGAEHLRRISRRHAATMIVVSELLVPGAMFEVEIIARGSG